MQREPSLLEVCISRVGVIRGSNVVVTVGLWALAMAQAGAEWPSGDDRGAATERVRRYQQAAVLRERTAWRHLRAFRECFPGEEDPSRIVQVLGLVDRIDQAHAADRLSFGSIPAGALV